MIHYHGTPVGGSRVDAARFLGGRHALVPFIRPDDIAIVAEQCQSFVLDSGAFSVWKRGAEFDTYGYLEWIGEWRLHPGYDWSLIPDVIDGDERENDEHVYAWPYGPHEGVPVWHLHESLLRLRRLAKDWPRVALGSSGQWATPGTAPWWRRMGEAMDAVCDAHGRPICRLHGLRMLDPRVFERLPLASADSTNAAVSSGSLSRYGTYLPPTAAQRAEVIAERVEAVNSSAVWARDGQCDMFEGAA